MSKLWIIVILSVHCLPELLAKLADESTYTEDEKIRLGKLRHEMKEELYQDYMHTDEYLIHWLRAKKLDVNQAKELLQKNLKWRKDEKIDSLPDEKFPQFESQYQADTEIRDKEGRPVVAQQISSWDVRKASLSGHWDQFFRYATKVWFEVPSKMARELGQASGTNSTQYYYLASLYGYNLRQHACIRCVQLAVYYINTYEQHYPQLIREHIMIHVPKAAKPIIDLTRPLWSDHLAKHIHFLTDEKKEWYKVMDKFFEREALPVAFGGTNPRKI